MRHETALLLLIAGLALAGAAPAADERVGDPSAATAQGDDGRQDQDRPEYRARPLPTDTFTPSESLPEDFPVAFPADI